LKNKIQPIAIENFTDLHENIPHAFITLLFSIPEPMRLLFQKAWRKTACIAKRGIIFSGWGSHYSHSQPHQEANAPPNASILINPSSSKVFY
jgi:hypothetical protein